MAVLHLSLPLLALRVSCDILFLLCQEGSFCMWLAWRLSIISCAAVTITFSPTWHFSWMGDVTPGGWEVFAHITYIFIRCELGDLCTLGRKPRGNCDHCLLTPHTVPLCPQESPGHFGNVLVSTQWFTPCVICMQPWCRLLVSAANKQQLGGRGGHRWDTPSVQLEYLYFLLLHTPTENSSKELTFTFTSNSELLL